MYTSSDFEQLFIRYKAEAVPSGGSIQNFVTRTESLRKLVKNLEVSVTS